MSRFQGLGCLSLGFKVYGLGYRVQGLGFRVGDLCSLKKDAIGLGVFWGVPLNKTIFAGPVAFGFRLQAALHGNL